MGNFEGKKELVQDMSDRQYAQSDSAAERPTKHIIGHIGDGFLRVK